jgi:pimeloyl-ACP methyl ester carboxylesterase
LWAWYVPSENGAAAVLRHGSGSTGSSVLAQAEVLARHGYGVLVTDARGHGRSSGRAMDFGWYGDTDIGAAVTFLAAQPDVDPDRIAVVGLSMGGEEALVDAARAAAPRPVLLIAAGGVPDEGHAAAHIQRHAPASVTVWVVPGAGHTQGLSVAPAEWERTVIGFLDGALVTP